MRTLLVVLTLALVAGCGRGEPAGDAAVPDTAAAEAPVSTDVPYRLVARGGRGLDVDVDGAVVGQLDANGELTVMLAPREACYPIHVRLTATETRGDCYVVEPPTPGPAGAEAPTRQIIWDLAAPPD